MGRSKHAIPLALAVGLLLASSPARATEDDETVATAFRTAGWQRAERGAAAPALERTFQGLGTVSAPPLTALRIESTLVTGPAPVPTFGVAVLAGRVAVDEMRAWGVRLPLLLGAPDESPIASGNLFVERHALLSTPILGRPVWSSTWRLILPAATGDRWFLLVPGHDRLGGGAEGAVAMFRTHGEWELHVELHAGLYLDAMMPLRSGFTAAAARSVSGPVSIFGQVDPWTVLIPPSGNRIEPGRSVAPTWSAQLGMALGARIDLGPADAILALQRILGHADDFHLHLALTLHR
jgi:hypothetical protein